MIFWVKLSIDLVYGYTLMFPKMSSGHVLNLNVELFQH